MPKTPKASNPNPNAPAPAPAIPGAENRMAHPEETRAEAAERSSALAAKPASQGYAFRGARKFVVRSPLVEDGVHHQAKSVIHLTARRANQLGADKVAPHAHEVYTDAPAPRTHAPTQKKGEDAAPPEGDDDGV